MVGSLEDAKDIVQDTFVKWLTVDHQTIKDTKAYLVKAVSNNCINYLVSSKRKKTEGLDAVVEHRLIDKTTEPHGLDMESELAVAISLLHKKLEPLEKAIYILREVFDLEYEHLQEIFDKKKENCRQLFCRAKEKINSETQKLKSDFIDIQPNFVSNFQKACSLGHLSDFIADLKHDISAKFSTAG